jgi:hypothetical protein
VPRFSIRVLAAASAVAIAALALTGCTQTPTVSQDNCSGIISKVLTTDDSATTVTPFVAGDIPKAFDIPSTPTPTCYYVTTTTLPPLSGVTYVQTQRTLLYIGISDSDSAAMIASLRKTVSVKPWTVRFDYGAPVASPGATDKPTAQASTSSSARWYYNFNGAATDDKGEMGYYATMPISQGTAIQAGLPKPENVLRIEVELKQVKK